MKAALAAALAFIFAACAVLVLFLFETDLTAERLQAEQLATARDGIARHVRDYGWVRTKAALRAQAEWNRVGQPHVWLVAKNSNKVVDAETSYPVETALRALVNTDKSVGVEGPGGSSRMHVTQVDMPDNRLLIGTVSPSANQPDARVVYAVGWSGVTGVLGALVAVYWASMRSNRRISDIKRTLSAFLSGDMTKRVAFPGPVDSLYELAHGVNRTLDQSENQAHNLNGLSTDIAHNLKKPLTRLRNQLEAASSASDIAPRYQVNAERAVRDLDGIIKIFEAQLNIYQFKVGYGRSRFRDVDLRALTAHIIEVYDSIIADSGKTLRMELPDKVPLVRGNPDLITEMIVNIIENAIQHCPPGTTILVSLVASSDEVSVIISDDGPGVPAEAVEAVLERFKRLDTSQPGHGIGMPFAVAVAELHEAMLELANNEPGLKVTVSFPIDFSKLTSQLGLRMRSGLNLKLQSEQVGAPRSDRRTLQTL